MSDARWLGKIRNTAAAKYRDDKIDISDCGAKVRQLIEEAVIAEGIQILVKQVSLFDAPIEQVMYLDAPLKEHTLLQAIARVNRTADCGPFSRSRASLYMQATSREQATITPEFEEKLKALKTDDARASEMEHAIKNEIHVKLDENPAFFTSLRERLEQIIADRKAKRIDAAQQLKLFEALKSELRGQAGAAEKLGLTETGFAVFGLLNAGGPKGKVDEAKAELVSLLEEQLAPQVGIVDWVHKDDVQREMRRLIKRQLKAAGYTQDQADAMAGSVVNLLKRMNVR